MTNLVPSFTRIILNIVSKNEPSTSVDVQYGERFSIQKLVFNKINLFDINFFTTDSNDQGVQIAIKNQISKVYYVLRNVAVVFLLLVLIYAGVRIAISSVAEDKAKYKKILIGWASSFALLLLLPYIMVTMLEISKIVMDLCESIMISLCGGNITQIEEDLLSSASGASATAMGSFVLGAILYWIIVFYQLKFFWIYFKRLFTTGFLIVIAPLVLVQYAFDKADDGEASSFKTWMTEFSLNIFMQPIHCVLYMIFMSIASNIITQAPILAALFLATMSRGERVIRNLLRVKNGNTVQSMKDSAVSHKKIMDLVGR